MTRIAAQPARGADVPRITNRIDEAREELKRERRILYREIDAFKDFHKQLHSMDSNSSPLPTESSELASTGGSATVKNKRSVPSSETPIREAYVETIMAIPHYEDEYGDTYLESISSEFGGEVAMALQQSSEVTGFLKQQVLASAHKAKASRKQLISVFDQEEAVLNEADEELQDICEELSAISSRPFYDCSVYELRQLQSDLDGLEDRCQNLAVRRQSGDLEPKTIPQCSTEFRVLNDYLYQSLRAPHPILNALARASNFIKTARRQIKRARSVASDS